MTEMQTPRNSASGDVSVTHDLQVAQVQTFPGTSTAAMRSQIAAWVEQGQLRALELALADLLLEFEPELAPLVLLAAVLVSHQHGRGHACLDLGACLQDGAFVLGWPVASVRDAQAGQPNPGWTPMDCLRNVTLANWVEQLARCTQVQTGEGASPLVLQHTRLYLRRQWQDERMVRAALAARLQPSASHCLREAWSTSQWRRAIGALFPASGRGGDQTMDWQQAACAVAASQRFAIITGGPGTGKTTTVVRLLALLQAMALGQAGQPWRIALAAPTGKAAARLGESIAAALDRLDAGALASVLGEASAATGAGAHPAAMPAWMPQALLDSIPREARTLHRLLGPRADSRRFRHHAAHPLPVDVLVVDEASMVDLDLMARLLEAMPNSARLILLGDKDQLASVEAGAVLGELCSRAHAGHYTEATASWLEAVTGQVVPAELRDAQGTPLDQAVVMLRHSHRFDAGSGIGRLASAVHDGQLETVKCLRESKLADLNWLTVTPDAAGERLLAQLVLEGQVRPGPAVESGERQACGYAHYLRVMHDGEQRWREPLAHGVWPDETQFDAWAREVLAAQRQFQLLCALREGPWGVTGLNRRVSQWLAQAGLVMPQSPWWAGRPIIVTANDHALGLMNGDIGVTLHRPVAREGVDQAPVVRPMVAFPAPDRPGGVRWVAPSRLNQVETVFAMTVHKSQGSEFAHAALVVPPAWSPVLTRELLYTGITRARQWCSMVLVGGQGMAVFEQAVRRRVQRASGLLEQP